MPFDDWQFYVVTLAAAWGAWAVVRTVVPKRATRGKHTSLTIEGRVPRIPD